jgi:hypothetical protein
MIDNWCRVVSLYNLKRLIFYTRLPTAPQTLNIAENLMTVEMFIENFKAKSGEIIFFFLRWLVYLFVKWTLSISSGCQHDKRIKTELQ